MKAFNHQGHKDLWNWLSENPSKKKYQYFKENKIPFINGYCYACEVVETCKECPLDWGTLSRTCAGSIYDEFIDAQRERDYIRASELAKQIANLPLKENTKWKSSK